MGTKYDAGLRGQQNQCPTCGELFGRNRTFDMHRTGTYEPPQRRCLTEHEMREKGLTKDARGFWRQPGRPGGWNMAVAGTRNMENSGAPDG
jgi:hypothetical protein